MTPSPVRGNSLSKGPVAIPSRSGGRGHVLTLLPDHSVSCATCTASEFGIKCHAAKRLESKIRKVNAETLTELLTVKERVYNILHLYPDARDSDLACIRHYFQDYHGLEPQTTWLELIALIGQEYHGNVIETVRRRRQEWQSLGHYESSDPAAAARRAKQARFHEEFGTGATA